MNPSTIKNVKQLANFLRCEEEFLAGYLAGDFYIMDRLKPVESRQTSDRTSIIEKLYLRKKKKHVHTYREIYSVRTDTLKSALKGLNTFLKQSYITSPIVHGYMQGRNIRTNAEVHLAKKYLLSVDISNFFESISAPMVEEALCRIGFSNFAALRLSKFVTINNFLPPGFNTSPTISNMVVKDMDAQFVQLCGKDCVYTRYADDLYFSSNVALPDLDDLQKIVSETGFSLNPDKTKYMPRGSKQYVTGLTVFDPIRPRVTRQIKRNLRLELYYLGKYGLREHALRSLGYSVAQYEEDKSIQSKVDREVTSIDMRVSGWIRFMKSVERPAALRFDGQYQKVVL